MPVRTRPTRPDDSPNDLPPRLDIGFRIISFPARRGTTHGGAFPDEIRRGLHGFENYMGAAGRTQFDERGDVVRYPQVFVIRDGQSVSIEQFEQDGGELPTPGRKST